MDKELGDFENGPDYDLVSNGNNGIFEAASSDRSKDFEIYTLDFYENSEVGSEFQEHYSKFRPYGHSLSSRKHSVYSNNQLTRRKPEINLKRSNELILALYKGYRVRKLLRENDVLKALMSIQDVNGYIEELEEAQDYEELDSIKEKRK